jgi:hypothetical protein
LAAGGDGAPKAAPAPQAQPEPQAAAPAPEEETDESRNKAGEKAMNDQAKKMQQAIEQPRNPAGK